jgi:hypothetical protein
MQWNAQRTSVGNRWGRGPAQVNGVKAEIQLPTRVGSVRALDGRGHPKGMVTVKSAANHSRFSIDPMHQTLWYEIEVTP